MPYEILIRGDEKTGAYKGAHTINKPGDEARPVKPSDWPALAKDINADAVERVDELEAAAAAAQSEIDELKAKLASVLDAAENSPEDLAAKVAEARQTRAQKRLAEIAEQRAQLDQEEAELKKPKETPQPSRRQ